VEILEFGVWSAAASEGRRRTPYLRFPRSTGPTLPRCARIISVPEFELSSKLLRSRLQVPAQKSNGMFAKNSLPQPIRGSRPFNFNLLVDGICTRFGNYLISVGQS
jgi:hypothetical protein